VHRLNFRKVIGNAALILLLATAAWAVLVDQKDKAASRPATESEVTRYRIAFARQRAKALHRFLMVEFGADWCEDCVVLARHLREGASGDYFQKYFELLMVDTGHSDRNLDIAASLGVDMSHGIPAALFFAADGRRIGATNQGELEPSRSYSSEAILRFLKEIVEQQRITKPGP
jgi:thioredoxin 1